MNIYLRRKNTIVPWIILGVVALVLFWLLGQIRNILLPFVLAAILAYILNPLVDKLEKKGIKRVGGSMLVMLFCFFVLLSLILVIVPMLLSQLNALIDQIPSFLIFIQDKALPRINELLNTHYSIDLTGHFVATLIQDNAVVIRSYLAKILPSIAQGGGVMITFVVNMVLLPFLLYYCLHDWPRWVDRMYKMVPRRWSSHVGHVTHRLDNVLGEFLRGQLLVMLIMGVIYGSLLSIVGLNSGFAIGMVAGILVFIPYLGAFTGLLLATVAALLQFDTVSGLLMVWGVFCIGQFLESFFITPYLLGERIGLTPLAVIFSLMAFGELMGFVGILLALPMAAICLVLIQEGLRIYYSSHFYLEHKAHKHKTQL